MTSDMRERLIDAALGAIDPTREDNLSPLTASKSLDAILDELMKPDEAMLYAAATEALAIFREVEPEEPDLDASELSAAKEHSRRILIAMLGVVGRGRL